MSEPESGMYDRTLRGHLAAYKTNVLGVAKNGTWRGREYGHILPLDRQERNIIEPYRDEFWDYWAEQEKQGKRLHEGFSHLNSSQGLCFNLFFPFFADDRQLISLLPTVLGLPSEQVRTTEFEYRGQDGTYVDFFFSTDQRRVSLEVKLSETGFGAAPEDEEHIRKLDTIYARRASRFAPQFFVSRRTFFRTIRFYE